jgi:hypothetical protein
MALGDTEVPSNGEISKNRREILISAVVGAVSGSFATYLIANPKPLDEIDHVYYRLWRTVSESELFGSETSRKPDAVRMNFHHQADGEPIYQLGLYWHRPGKESIASTEPMNGQDHAYRIWFGIWRRFGIPMETNLPDRNE